jgi:hypothetical protein
MTWGTVYSYCKFAFTGSWKKPLAFAKPSGPAPIIMMGGGISLASASLPTTARTITAENTLTITITTSLKNRSYDREP